MYPISKEVFGTNGNLINKRFWFGQKVKRFCLDVEV
jgi:hypothetical protein